MKLRHPLIKISLVALLTSPLLLLAQEEPSATPTRAERRAAAQDAKIEAEAPNPEAAPAGDSETPPARPPRQKKNAADAQADAEAPAVQETAPVRPPRAAKQTAATGENATAPTEGQPSAPRAGRGRGTVGSDAVSSDPEVLVQIGGPGRAAFNVINPGPKKQKGEPVTVDGNPAFNLVWQPGAKPLVEAAVRTKPLIYAFENGVKLTIPIKADDFPELTAAGVRLADADGEVWQFGGIKIPKDRSGWTDLTVDLSKRFGVQNWGGSDAGKGKIDPPVQLMALIFNAPNTGMNERVLTVGNVRRNSFDPAEIEASVALLPLKVEAETGQAVPLVLEGKENEIKLIVSNATGAPEISVKLHVTAIDSLGAEKTWSSEAITLGPEESKAVSPGGIFGAYGITEIIPKLEKADGTASLVKTPVAVAYIKPLKSRALPPADGYWIGIDARIREQTQWIPEVAALMGADILRGGVNWPALQTSENEWDWALHENDLGLMKKAGLATMHSFSFTPDWAARPEFVEKLKKENLEPWRLGRTPPRPETIKSAASAVATKNREFNVPHMDLWNEPDLRGFWMGSTDDYLEFMKLSYEGIKAVSPETIILSGGIATVGSHRGHELNPDLIERMIVDGQDYYDALSLHLHGRFGSFQQMIDGVVAKYLSKVKENKPLYFTETGAPTGPSLSEEEAAAELVKKMAFAKTRGAMGFLWFILRPAGGDTQPYGMFTRKNEPRPAVPAFSAFARVMRDTAPRRELPAGTGNWVLPFDGADHTLLLVWDENSPSPGSSLLVRVPAGATAKKIDLMGNETNLEVQDNLAVIELAKVPAYYKVPKEGSEILGQLAVFQESVYGEPGRKTNVLLSLKNPTESALKYELEWTNHDGENKKEAVEVAPGETGTASLEVIMPAAKAGETAPEVSVNYTVAGKPWSGSLKLPLNVAKLIPASSVAGRPAADFEISKYPDQIFNANENDPTRTEYTWKGAEDLSAKIWLGLDQDALVVKVDVTDDVQKQDHPAEQMWQGDSLQMGLALPSREGFWEIAFARGSSGEGMSHVFSAPSGLSAAYASTIKMTTTPRKGGMIYEIRLPYEGLGIDAAGLRKEAIGFNLVVNDDDGGGREGFGFITDGLGKAKNRSLWPLTIFE